MNFPFTTAEFILYWLSAIVPCVILTVWTFRKRNRLPRTMTALACAVLVGLQLILHLFVVYRFPSSLYFLCDLAGGVLYFIFMAATIQESPSRLFFYLLILSDFSNLFVILGKHLESLFSMEMALQRYRWSFSLCMLAVEAVGLPLLYALLFRTFARLGEEGSDAPMWKFLWLVPATFNLLWMLLYYDMPGSAVQRAVGNSYWLFKLLIDAGSLLIYQLILSLVQEHVENLKLQKQIYEHSLQASQYQSLSDLIETTRQFRHDMRHQLAVIGSLAEKNNNTELQAYIRELMHESLLNAPVSYCENAAANAVLQYYLYEAEKDGIRTEVYFALPSSVFISPVDITNLLGNLLKNALEACRRDRMSDPFITVRGRLVTENVFALIVENPFVTGFLPESGETFSSRNHKGSGLGLQSVRSIADRYGGAVKVSSTNGLFRVSVLLYKPEVMSPPPSERINPAEIFEPAVLLFG